MWPFERGRSYNRRQDIHARYGGQQQGGIISPIAHPLVIAITGEAGAQHGYADRLRPDGAFDYFGEGQLGDMKMVVGNKAIESHSRSGKSLLLFTKQQDARLRFEGEYVCESFRTERAHDREGQLREAIVFQLRPLEALEDAVEQGSESASAINDLRELAFAAASDTASAQRRVGNVFARSRAVRQYVLARAQGSCEGCASAAPFLRADGTPYLEPHHIRRVSDGGPDDPRFVIALCPNCHRRVHAGSDGQAYNGRLASRIKQLEPEAWRPASRPLAAPADDE